MRIFCVAVILSIVFVNVSVAQSLAGTPTIPDATVQTPERAPEYRLNNMGMNPAMLMRMRDQLTFEIQQTQRTLGFLDPNDTQLSSTLKQQQTELLNQLKDVNAQLKAQGVPTESPVEGETPTDPNLLIQRRDDPTLPMTPNSLIPSMPMPPSTPRMPDFPMPPNPMGAPGSFPGVLPPGAVPGTMPNISGGAVTPFDQDQAWADAPWAPQPSKELTELKQTVDALRKELGEMRESIKALETQIQLLNRNILLNQTTK